MQLIPILFLGFCFSQIYFFEEELTIKNSTNSYIEEIHIDGGENILKTGSNISPKGTLVVKVNCTLYSTASKITLVFDDDDRYTFVDKICDGDLVWDITDDGNHSENGDDGDSE